MIDFLFDEKEVCEKLNQKTMKEIAEYYNDMNEYSQVKYHDGDLVEFITHGWSENEHFLSLLRHYFCKHRYHYVGYLVGGSIFFTLGDNTSDYEYNITSIEKSKKINCLLCEYYLDLSENHLGNTDRCCYGDIGTGIPINPETITKCIFYKEEDND